MFYQPIRVRTGDVVEFDYLQPKQGKQHRMIKVLEVRNTERNPVRHKRHKTKRSKFLVTGMDHQGKIRSFYTMYAANPYKLSANDVAVLEQTGVTFPAIN